MSTQVLSRSSPELAIWVGWLRTHAAITRRLNADLVTGHGLTISDYEVLLLLSRAPDRVLKPVDLAERVILSPSGVTRLLAGLERADYVRRTACASDRRVSYAQLTNEGAAKLREASRTHLAGIAELFTGRYSQEELETLSDLLARLPGADGDSPECSPD